MIRVQALSYTYPDGRQALSEISLAVERSESVGIVGPNGAGKTTLFLCLAGILKTSPGSISIANLDPADPGQRRLLPAKLGFVFQNSDDQIFNSTVFDDVAFGPLNLGLDEDEVRRRVLESLEQVDLKGFEKRVAFHLSGGEQRRVALAGILAMRPEILVLDEPSQGLDPRGRRELMHLLAQLQVTKVIASHDLELILQTCPRVLVLDQGRLIADGPAREMLANDSLMYKHGLEVPHSLRPHVSKGQHPMI
jgi:cobalt/nickel transport system ATP-binding protein